MQKTILNLIIFSCLIFIFSCKKAEKKEINNLEKDTHQQLVDDDPKPQEKATSKYSTYKGAWFDIEYPSDFKVENSLKSSTNSEGFDSAFFTSPDGKVQFYIFSPQWSGKPEEVKIQENEKLVESKSENHNGIFIKRWTVAAKDGSYYKSFEESSEAEGTINKVFGIKYASKKDLEHYRDEYLHFKNSLKQYAD